MKRIDFEEAYKHVNSFYSQELSMYGYYGQTTVSTGDENDINKGYCIQNGYRVFYLSYSGGTIVSESDCLCVINLSKDNSFIGKFALDFKEFLQKNGINVEINGNDFIVDGQFKTASFVNTYINETYLTFFHIPVSVDLEKIRNVCKKEMKKVPKGLSEYGLTAKKIEEMLANYWFYLTFL